MKKIFILLTTLFAASAAYSQSESPNIEPIFEMELNRAEKVTELGDGHYLIDFGKAFWGRVIIKSKESQESPITIHAGEKLASDGTVDKKPGGTIRYQKVVVDKLTPGEVVEPKFTADKRNSNAPAVMLPDSFGVVIPFRYCEVENLKGSIKKIDILQKSFYYKFDDDASAFSSSDTVLNAVWDLCKHTIKATTFAGYYVDGDRERIPYEADAYINQLSHYSIDSEYTIARRTNEYFITHPTWPTEWLLHTVLLFYQDYMYTGNLEALRRNYETLKTRTLIDLERKDGLISSKSSKLDAELKRELGFSNPRTKIKDIVDWPPAQKDTGWKLSTENGERDGYEMVDVNTVVNSFYYYNMVLMSGIAKDLGKDIDAAMFKERAEKTKETINQKLFNSEKGIYLDGEGSDHSSLHANMFPLAFGLVPTEHIESVTNFIKSRGMACSVYGAQYLLEGLFQANDPEYALHLITDTTHDRTWWNMIELGSTMTLEAWDMKYKPNSDWNHAWGTAPANIITRHLWGVTPKTPGFGTVQIKPQITGLSYTTIKVPTPNGAINGSYKISKKGSESYKIELPLDMEGEFILPQTYSRVKLNGKLVEGKVTSLPLKEGVNKIKLQ